MKKILLPTDFSQPALNAFRFAVELVKSTQGSMHLLHVIELPVLHDTTLMPTLSFEQQYLEDATELANKKFRQMIASVKGGDFITSSVEYGGATTVILDVAKKKKSDLIVMGTQGASGLKEFFVGSNTEKIVRLAEVPVLALPPGAVYKEIRNVILPTSLFGDQDVLVEHVKTLTKHLKARLHILYVNTPALFRADTQSTDLLGQLIRKYQLKDAEAHIWNDVSEESGVVNFASRTGSCMVVMATHGRRGLAHLMTGSIAEDVVNHIRFPVWSVKASGKKRKS